MLNVRFWPYVPEKKENFPHFRLSFSRSNVIEAYHTEEKKFPTTEKKTFCHLVHIINFMIFMLSTWLYRNRFLLLPPHEKSFPIFSILKHFLVYVCVFCWMWNQQRWKGSEVGFCACAPNNDVMTITSSMKNLSLLSSFLLCHKTV